MRSIVGGTMIDYLLGAGTKPMKRCLFIATLLTILCLVGCEAQTMWRGEPASHWVDLLAMGDRAERRQAADALNRILRQSDPGRPIPTSIERALTQALDDVDPVVRLDTAVVLAWAGKQTPSVRPILLDVIRDRGIGPLLDATGRTLADLSPRIESVLTPVIHALDAEYGEVSIAASVEREEARRARILAAAHKPIEQWNAGEQTGDEEQKRAALEDLRHLAPASGEAVDFLLARLRENPDDRTQVLLIETLGRIGPDAAAACEPLTDLFNQMENIEVKVACLTALGQVAPDARTTAELLTYRGLRSPKANVRTAAATALSKVPTHPDYYLQPGADIGAFSYYQIHYFVNALIERLSDSSPSVRMAAARTLGRIDRPVQNLTDILVEATSDTDPQVRAAVLRALGEWGDATSAVLEVLTRSLADRESAVQAAAAWAFGRLESSAIDAAPDLIGLLGSKEAPVRAAAAEALGSIGKIPGLGEDSIARLTDLLDDSNPDVRIASIGALGALDNGSKAVLARLGGMLDDRATTAAREAAVNALGRFGPVSRPAADRLTALLSDPQPTIRLASAQALGWMDDPSTAPLAVLIDDVDDPEGEASQREISPLDANPLDPVEQSILVLGWLGEKAEPAAPALIRTLKNFQRPIRQRYLAAAALGSILPGLTAPFPALIEPVRTRRDRSRIQAATALGWLGVQPKDALPPLIETLADPGNPVDLRFAAAAALGRSEPHARQIAPHLAAMLADPDRRVRAGAAMALGELGPEAESAVQSLIQILEDSDPWVRRSAATALSRTGGGSDRTVPALLGALRDPDYKVRYAVAEALGAVGSAAMSAIPILNKVHRNDSNRIVRQAADDAVSRIRGY